MGEIISFREEKTINNETAGLPIPSAARTERSPANFAKSIGDRELRTLRQGYFFGFQAAYSLKASLIPAASASPRWKITR